VRAEQRRSRPKSGLPSGRGLSACTFRKFFPLTLRVSLKKFPFGSALNPLGRKSGKRAFAALIAGTFFFTTVAEPWAQSGFWEQQRAARQNLYRDVDPQTAEAKALLRGLVWPKEATQPLFGSFKLSANLGSVIETHLAPSEQSADKVRSRTVFHIQDAHGVFGAQYNASQILAGLAQMEREAGADGRRAGLLVLQEGGTGPVATDWLASFPFPDVKSDVAEAHLRQGTLTGEEYRAVAEAPGRLRLFGAETAALYRRNLAARHDTVAERMRAVRHLGRLRERVEALKARTYPAGLLELDRRFRAHAQKDLSFTEYLQELARLSSSPVRQEEFPNIHALLLLTRLEAALDQKALAAERAALIEQMAEHLSLDALKELVGKATELRLGRVHPRVFYEGLLSVGDLLKRKGADISTAHLRTYVSYLQLMGKIDHARLLAESEQFKGRLLDVYSGSDAVWRLVLLDKRLDLEQALWEQRMSPDQFALYQQQGPLNWLETEKYLIAQETARGLAATPLSTEQALSWLSALPQMRRFYELAHERDAAFVDNALAEMTRSGDERAVLIAGGFHTPGVTRLLREKGVNYVVIQPRFETAKAKDAAGLQISHFIDRRAASDGVREPTALNNPMDRAANAGDLLGTQLANLVATSAENRDRLANTLREWAEGRLPDADPDVRLFQRAVLVTPDGRLMALGRAQVRGKYQDMVLIYDAQADKTDTYIGEEQVRRARQDGRLSFSQTDDISDKFARLLGEKGSSWETWKLFMEDIGYKVKWFSGDADVKTMVDMTARLIKRGPEPILPQSRRGQERIKEFARGVTASAANIAKKPAVLTIGVAAASTLVWFLITQDISALQIIGLALTSLTVAVTHSLPKKHSRLAQPLSYLSLVAIAGYLLYAAPLAVAMTSIGTLLGFALIMGRVRRTLAEPLRRLLGSASIPPMAKRAVTAVALMMGVMTLFPNTAEAAEFVNRGQDVVVRFQTNPDGTPMAGENLFNAARQWLMNPANPNHVANPTPAQVGAEYQRLLELNQDNPFLGALQTGPYAGQPGSLVYTHSHNGAEYVVHTGQAPATPEIAAAAPVQAPVVDTASAPDSTGHFSLLVSPAYAQDTSGSDAGTSFAAMDALIGLAVLAALFVVLKLVTKARRARQAKAQAASDKAAPETAASQAPVESAAPSKPEKADDGFPASLVHPESLFAKGPKDAGAANAEGVRFWGIAADRLNTRKVVLFIEAIRDRLPKGTTVRVTASTRAIGLRPSKDKKSELTLNLRPSTTAGELWRQVQADLEALTGAGTAAAAPAAGEVSPPASTAEPVQRPASASKTSSASPPSTPRGPPRSGGPVNPVPPSGSEGREIDALVKKITAFLKEGPRTSSGQWRPEGADADVPIYATFGQHGVMATYDALPVLRKMIAAREDADREVGSLLKSIARAEKQVKEAAAGEEFRLAQVPQINREIAELEARLAHRRLELQRGLLDRFEAGMLERRDEILSQGKGSREGLENMLTAFYQRLDFYRNRRVPTWFNEAPAGRAVKLATTLLSIAYTVALVSLTFWFSQPAGWFVLGVSLPIYYGFSVVAQKIVYLFALPFVRTPGHKRVDFVDHVREQARIAGKPYRFDIKVPKLSTNKADADAWFTYRRRDLQSLRDTFRAVGDDFQVTFIMNSNTKLKETAVLDYEVESILRIQAEADADPVLKGRVKFLYMHQSMHWFDNGKPLREGWAKKVGSVMSSEWFLTLGHTRPPAYTDRKRFRHALNGEEAMFDRLEGDFMAYFGDDGRVTFEVRGADGGTSLVTVTNNADFKRLATDKNTLRIVQKSEGPEFSITIDDKNSLGAGEVEKAIAIMAHPENSGIVLGNPRIEVDPPMTPNDGNLGEAMGSYWLDSMQKARNYHNSFTAVMTGAIHDNASAMFGKFIARNRQYAESFMNEYLQPDRMLSHDWNESVFSPTEALYGDPNAKIRQLGKKNEGGREVYTFSVTAGSQVRLYRIAMEGAGKPGARAELLTQDEDGAFVPQRTYEFAEKRSRTEIARHVSGFLTNTFMVYERDFLTFGSVIDRDLRWLRGDWQMWFTFHPYRDVLYPQARMHLSGITRRFLGDASFLLQTVVFSSFFFLPFLMDVHNLWLAKMLLAVVLVTFAGVDNYFVPIWQALKKRFDMDIAVNKPKRLLLAGGLAVGMIFMGGANFIIITLVALQALVLRPIYAYKLRVAEKTGNNPAWHASSAQSVQELKGLSAWQTFSYLRLVFKIGLFLAIPVFLMLSMGNMYLSVLGPLGLGVFLSAYLLAPTLISHLAGKPYSRDKKSWKSRFQRFVLVLIMAATVLPTFLVPLEAIWRDRQVKAREPASWVERLQQSLSQEELYQQGRFVPPYRLEFSANPAMQQTMTAPIRLPPLVSPFTSQEPIDVEMSLNPIPRDALPRGALPENITRTQMVSPFNMPMQEIQALNLIQRQQVTNLPELQNFIQQVERFNSGRVRGAQIGVQAGKTGATALSPIGGYAVKAYEVRNWIRGRNVGRDRGMVYRWLDNPLVANYWVEMAMITGNGIERDAQTGQPGMADLFLWDQLELFYEIDREGHRPAYGANGRRLGDGAWWARYLVPGSAEFQSLGIEPALRDRQGRVDTQRYQRLARDLERFKYEYLSTAIMSLHYGMGEQLTRRSDPNDPNSPLVLTDQAVERVARFLIRAYEMEEMWKDMLGDTVDITAYQLLPKGMRYFNRQLGTFLFFFPIRIPILSDLPLGLMSTAEMFTNRPGGAIETMTQLVLRNQITPQQFMDIIGWRYIRRFYDGYFEGRNFDMTAGLARVVHDRMRSDWERLRPDVVRANPNAFAEYLRGSAGRKAYNILYLQTEYMLGTTAVYNDVLRLRGEGRTAEQIAAELHLSVQTVQGFLQGQRSFREEDMDGVQLAATGRSSEHPDWAAPVEGGALAQITRINAIVNDGRHDRVRAYYLYEPGILEGEAVQMYMRARRQQDPAVQEQEIRLVLDRAEPILAQIAGDPVQNYDGFLAFNRRLGAGLNSDFVERIFLQLPEAVRTQIAATEGTPGKYFTALRSLAMLAITMERNNLGQVSLAQMQSDYVNSLTHLQAHPRVPSDQPGIVEYFVILRHQLFQRPEMRARWGEDEAAFSAGFWQHFNERLRRVNQFLSQTNAEAERAFRQSETWRTYETWVNEEIGRLSGAPVVNERVRFYNALMTMTEMVIDVERKFPDLRGTPQAELMTTLAARHTRYRAVFQELGNADWNSKEGFLESFVTAGYRINDVDREVREVFFLREVNALWRDGALWQGISRDRGDDFLRLVRMRMERDFRDLNLPEGEIERLLGDDTLTRFIALQTFHRLGHSALYNENYDHENGRPRRDSFSLDEITAAGSAVLVNFGEVFRRAQGHAGILGYFETEPGIIENEAVLLYLMNRQPDGAQNVAAYLRDMETAFPVLERLIQAGTLTREHLQLPENDIRRRYIDEMFMRMRENVRGQVTDGGKVFNALRSLATLVHTGSVNNISLSPQAWMQEYMDALGQFRAPSRNYRHIPYMRSGIVEFFIMMKATLGWDDDRFWNHFHERLRRVDAQMGDAALMQRLGRPGFARADEAGLSGEQRAWRAYETGVNEEIARTSGIDVRHNDVQVYNALMAMTEMIIDTENKFPEHRGRVDILRLSVRYQHYAGLQGELRNLPWAERGFRESLVTSGYRLNDFAAERRMFLLDEINTLMIPGPGGSNIASRHPNRARLAEMVRAESPDPRLAERVIDFLILQKVVSIGRTFNLTLTPDTVNRLMRDIVRMEDRVGELTNLRNVFQVRGEREKWIGIGIAMGLPDVDAVFEQFLLPINRNYRLARDMYVRSSDFNELSASLENANGVMAQDIGSYERSSGLPEGSIVRPRMNEEQMIVDRVFFDIQRLRALNLQFDLEQFLQRYYRNVQFLKGAEFYGPQLRRAAADGAEDLGKLNGQIDNYAYTFALLHALAFAEGGSAEFREGLRSRGLNSVEDVMRAFHGNLQFINGLPNMSAALQDLRNQNEFAADGAAFSYALMLTLNERLPREELARLDRQFPNIFRDYEQTLGVSPRIDSPILLYEALQRDLRGLRIFGDRTDQLEVRTLRLNGNWLTDAVVKEAFRSLFQIYLDEDPADGASREDRRRAEAHAELLRHYENLARTQSMSSILDQLVGADTIPDPDAPGPVDARPRIPNPFKARLGTLSADNNASSIAQTIEQIRREIAEARQRGFHAQANQLEERDLETWLNNRQSFVERLEFLRRMAAEFDRAEVDARDEQYKVITELLLAMLLLGFALGAAGGAYSLARRGLAKKEDKGKYTPHFPTASLIALLALGVAPYAATHWGDLSDVKTLQNLQAIYGTDQTRADQERTELRQGEAMSPAQARQMLEGLAALRHQSGILADNSTAAGMRRTKPTNIAMDLMVTMTARRQGLMNAEETEQADRRVLRTLEILQQLRRQHVVDGLFPEFVRISPDGTLTPIRTPEGTVRYSSIDSGWLTMALAALRNNYPADSEIGRLAAALLDGETVDGREVRGLLQEQGYRSLLDREGRLGGGFEISASGQRVPSNAFNFSYGDRNSEARVVVLALIGLGQLPDSAYTSMRLEWTEREGVRVARGFHMSAFVALTGNVFYPEAELSPTWREAHEGYVRATFLTADRLGHRTAGYAPAARNARLYREYGLDNAREGVSTPYAAALLTTLVNGPDSARAVQNLQAIFAAHGDRQPLPDALSSRDGAVLNPHALGLDQALLFLAANRGAVQDMLGAGNPAWVQEVHRLIRGEQRRTAPAVTPGGGTDTAPSGPVTPTPSGTPGRRAALDGLPFGGDGLSLGAMLPMLMLGLFRGRRSEDDDEGPGGGSATAAGDGGPKPLSPRSALRALQKEILLNQFGIASNKTSRRSNPMRLQQRRLFLQALAPTGERAKAWADGKAASRLTSRARFLDAVRTIVRDDYGVELSIGDEVLDAYADDALFGEMKMGVDESGAMRTALEPGFLINVLRPFHRQKSSRTAEPVKVVIEAREDAPSGARVEPAAGGDAVVVNLHGMSIGNTVVSVPNFKYVEGPGGREQAVQDGVKTMVVPNGADAAAKVRGVILAQRDAAKDAKTAPETSADAESEPFAATETVPARDEAGEDPIDESPAEEGAQTADGAPAEPARWKVRVPLFLGATAVMLVLAVLGAMPAEALTDGASAPLGWILSSGFLPVVGALAMAGVLGGVAYLRSRGGRELTVLSLDGQAEGAGPAEGTAGPREDGASETPEERPAAPRTSLTEAEKLSADIDREMHKHRFAPLGVMAAVAAFFLAAIMLPTIMRGDASTANAAPAAVQIVTTAAGTNTDPLNVANGFSAPDGLTRINPDPEPYQMDLLGGPQTVDRGNETGLPTEISTYQDLPQIAVPAGIDAAEENARRLYGRFAADAIRRHGMDRVIPASGGRSSLERAIDLVFAIMRQESQFRTGVVSRTGYHNGLMQVANGSFNPQRNIEQGVEIFMQKYRTFDNGARTQEQVLELAVASYNGGEGNGIIPTVRRWARNLQAFVTRRQVRGVLDHMVAGGINTRTGTLGQVFSRLPGETRGYVQIVLTRFYGRTWTPSGGYGPATVVADGNIDGQDTVTPLRVTPTPVRTPAPSFTPTPTPVSTPVSTGDEDDGDGVRVTDNSLSEPLSFLERTAPGASDGAVTHSASLASGAMFLPFMFGGVFAGSGGRRRKQKQGESSDETAGAKDGASAAAEAAAAGVDLGALGAEKIVGSAVLLPANVVSNEIVAEVANSGTAVFAGAEAAAEKPAATGVFALLGAAALGSLRGIAAMFNGNDGLYVIPNLPGSGYGIIVDARDEGSYRNGNLTLDAARIAALYSQLQALARDGVSAKVTLDIVVDVEDSTLSGLSALQARRLLADLLARAKFDDAEIGRLLEPGRVALRVVNVNDGADKRAEASKLVDERVRQNLNLQVITGEAGHAFWADLNVPGLIIVVAKLISDLTNNVQVELTLSGDAAGFVKSQILGMIADGQDQDNSLRRFLDEQGSAHPDRITLPGREDISTEGIEQEQQKAILFNIQA
jgi:hypothetical protein